MTVDRDGRLHVRQDGRLSARVGVGVGVGERYPHVDLERFAGSVARSTSAVTPDGASETGGASLAGRAPERLRAISIPDTKSPLDTRRRSRTCKN